MWWVKLIVVVLLLAAVFSLGRALMALVKGEKGEGKSRTMKALAWRVAFSAGVFLFILFSMLMGWITPHDVNPNKLYGQPIHQQAPADPGSVPEQ
ncbi:MAG: twin transmembrane helix small protein [Alcanivorax sediminis]|uniref:Twin transmembrane helix small protein n=1 Tax=Alcanivorax sediminis TaxID=2663008 RepID=A0A6N7LS46_9GAMM|nr:twin transmembrane helix small protein [Alcanivorax sediminis]MQX53187.1 twin transmembrane helix small protein [Alcanivorax sediminis]